MARLALYNTRYTIRSDSATIIRRHLCFDEVAMFLYNRGTDIVSILVYYLHILALDRYRWIKIVVSKGNILARQVFAAR